LSSQNVAPDRMEGAEPKFCLDCSILFIWGFFYYSQKNDERKQNADFRNIKCINRFGKTYVKQLQSCEVL